MIKTKSDLKEYIKCDNWYYDKYYSSWDQKLFVFLRDPQYMLRKYKLFLRKEEYCLNNPTKWNTIKRLYFLRKKNIIGNKLGVLIPPNTFGKGLQIMHHGCIIANPNAKIGDYCILHGNNCIGKNVKSEKAPMVGDNLDLGIGANLIGGITLGDNVIVGANAVVNKDFDSNIVIAGVPAKVIKENFESVVDVAIK